MDRNRRRAMWWLVCCLAVAAVLVGMTANRIYNAVQLEQSIGANAMSWDGLIEAVESLALGAVVVVAGLVPAAWIGLRGRTVEHVVHAPPAASDVAA